MPEKRGVQATEEIKAEWATAYKLYLKAPGDRYDKKKNRTFTIDFVAPGDESDSQAGQASH